MSLTWAVELPASAGDAALSLRLVAGVEARRSAEDGSLWLRGRDLDEISGRVLLQLPCRRRFTLMEDGRAVPEGSTVPVMKMPGSGWVPLRHLEALALPPVRRAGKVMGHAPIHLIPATASRGEHGPNLVLVTFRKWHDYAVTAPMVRLAPLRFSVSDDGRAAIHGEPLPPLLGTFYTASSGIAVPIGRSLEPALSFETLARHFQLGRGDILLFHDDGTTELLDGNGFSAATRSAARATLDSLEAGIKA